VTRAGKKIGHESMAVSGDITMLHDASLQTAASTGTLSYMEFSKVQRFAEAYQLQRQFADMQSNYVNRMPDLLSLIFAGVDPDKMSKGDAAATIGDVRKAMSALETMREVGSSLDESYTKTLKSE
jgi:hypothetical protein